MLLYRQDEVLGLWIDPCRLSDFIPLSLKWQQIWFGKAQISFTESKLDLKYSGRTGNKEFRLHFCTQNNFTCAQVNLSTLSKIQMHWTPIKDQKNQQFVALATCSLLHKTPWKRHSSGSGLQRKAKGQVCEVTHVRLFASPLDVFQSFYLGTKRKAFWDV